MPTSDFQSTFNVTETEIILYTTVGYEDDDVNTVRPYGPDLVSIPSSGDQPVELLQVLDPVGRDFVKDPLSAMMLTDDEFGEVVEHNKPVKPFMDAKLQQDQGCYEGFVQLLLACGMITFTARPLDLATPLFVRKKNNRLRFILDCRAVNRRFRKPPRLARAAGSTWAQVVVPQNETLYVGRVRSRTIFTALQCQLTCNHTFVFLQSVQSRYRTGKLKA